MKIKINLNGQEHEFDVIKQGNRLRVVRDGETAELEIHEAEGHTFAIMHAGRLIRGAGIKDGDQRHLWVNGRTIHYERVHRRSGGPGTTSADSLSSTIPAVVSEILVSEGDEVHDGQKLILLESMKMIIPIQAPHDGVVTALKCAAGESVQPGVPLVEVRPRAGGS